MLDGAGPCGGANSSGLPLVVAHTGPERTGFFSSLCPSRQHPTTEKEEVQKAVAEGRKPQTAILNY
jgi:hypothetical protein